MSVTESIKTPIIGITNDNSFEINCFEPRIEQLCTDHRKRRPKFGNINDDESYMKCCECPRNSELGERNSELGGRNIVCRICKCRVSQCSNKVRIIDNKMNFYCIQHLRCGGTGIPCPGCLITFQ